MNLKRASIQKITILLLVTILGLFVFTNPVYANFSPSSVIFNEIAWMGTLTSASDEWIEIYNPTSDAKNLENWRILAIDGTPVILLSGMIEAGGYFLIEKTDDDSVANISADLIYSGSLGNNGESLELRDNNDNLIDFIEASSGWDGGDNSTKQTLERKQDLSWQTSALAEGTPKQINSSGADIPVVVENNNNKAVPTSSNSISQKPCFFGDILISEFVSAPSDDEVEWIELYNTTFKEININNWKITDGSDATTELSGTIPGNKFFVIESPKGKLNNAGDIITLRDENNVLIDEVIFGDWNNGDSKNAPAASNPYSVARQQENYNTKNNFEDFRITTTPTKGLGNIISLPAEKITQATLSSEEIIITEIFPNPVGTDYEEEFIELFNSSKEAVKLEDWRLEDENGMVYIFEETTIEAQEYFSLTRAVSGIVLNNNSDTVKLFKKDAKKSSQTVSYNNALEGGSYNFNVLEAELTIVSSASLGWTWEETISPGEINIIKRTTQAPNVEFYFPDTGTIGIPIFFDSSDTSDNDSKELYFLWDFGDGATNTLPDPEHTYFISQIFKVLLAVSDGENTVRKEKNILITSGLDNSFPTQEFKQTDSFNQNIIINEILPNPIGANEEEWIEIYNQGDTRINLLNWQLDDDEEESQPYFFENDFWLDKNEYKIISRTESKLALNNDFDVVRIFDNQENLIEEIKYEAGQEGNSYARGMNNKWFWTASSTPENENNISLASSDYYQVLDYSFSPPVEIKSNNFTPIAQIKNLLVGDNIITEGIVTVLPGILGSQFFYIASSTGLQVYNFNKDFPELQIGDLIEVQGELSRINNEWRLKTKTADDMIVIDTLDALVGEKLACGEVNDEFLSQLITVSGEIIEQKGSTLYLDDGTDELLVFVKTTTGIDPKKYTEGNFATVTGILSQTRSGIRLLPRLENDIIEKKLENNSAGKVLGEISANSEWQLASRNKNIKLYKYLLVIMGAIIISLISFLIKKENKA